MKVYSKSDIGLKRDSNQDYCFTKIFPDKTALAIVCDGMGGANGGSTASHVAVETIVKEIEDNYDSSANGEQIKSLISSAVQKANGTVYDIASKDPSLYGMGTTVVCAMAKDNLVHIVHAGDSRAYLYQNNQIEQITTDHSMVQEMLIAGQITQEEAKNHPKKNIITRALGVEPMLRTDYISEKFEKDSELVICTDGLSNYINNESLLYFIQNNSGNELTEKLIESAKELGGRDNITVAVISSQES